MGLLRFLTPQRDRVDDCAVQLAYVASMDGIPTSSHKTWEEDRLLRLERPSADSGKLYIPWRVEGYGQTLLSTSSLMERERPYHLPVELARGTLNRLRMRTEAWRTAGLQVSDETILRTKSAQASFIHAATTQRDALAAAVSAEETIRESLDAIGRLGQEHADQVLNSRHEESGALTTLLAGTLGDTAMSANVEPMYCAAFNAAIVPFRWKTIQTAPDTWDWTQVDKRIQWCQRNGLKILGGPLLRLDSQCLPDWLLGESKPSFQDLEAAVRTFVGNVVDRYRTDVHLWHSAAGTNAAGVMDLSDDQKVRLTMSSIEITHRTDARTPIFISFDQPWGEYMSTDATDLWPIHFADMLIRADMGIAGIGLEMNFGYWPGGTLPRDVLEISEHVDYWSQLGLPLIIQLAVPSSAAPDPLASADAGQPISAVAEGLTPQTQQGIVEQLLPAFLAKRSVHVVTWNQVFDSSPHKFAHAGLFDAQDRPKPALTSLIAARRDHLQ